MNDNYLFCSLVHAIGNKATLAEEGALAKVDAVLKDETKSQEVLDAAKMSMGTDISDIDLVRLVCGGVARLVPLLR